MTCMCSSTVTLQRWSDRNEYSTDISQSRPSCRISKWCSDASSILFTPYLQIRTAVFCFIPAGTAESQCCIFYFITAGVREGQCCTMMMVCVQLPVLKTTARNKNKRDSFTLSHATLALLVHSSASICKSCSNGLWNAKSVVLGAKFRKPAAAPPVILKVPSHDCLWLLAKHIDLIELCGPSSKSWM